MHRAPVAKREDVFDRLLNASPEINMNAFYVMSGVIAVALLLYLIYALVNAEKF